MKHFFALLVLCTSLVSSKAAYFPDTPFNTIAPLDSAGYTNVVMNNMAAGYVDVFTPPSGYVAWPYAITELTTNGIGSTNYLAYKTNGIYYRISDNRSIAAAPGVPVSPLASVFVFTSTETFAVSNTIPGNVINVTFLVWPTPAPFKTIKLINPATVGSNLVYTVPTGSRAKLTGNSTLLTFGTTGFWQYVNQTGASTTNYAHVIPLGGVTNANNIYRIAATTTDDATGGTAALPSMFNSGDKLVWYAGSNATNQMVWITVQEITP